MKFSAAALLLSFSTIALALDTTGLPDCSLACLASAIPQAGCTLDDSVCQCTTGQTAITSNATPCIVKQCSASDAAKVLPAAQAICSRVLASASTSGTGGTATAASSGTATKAVAPKVTTNAAVANAAQVVGIGAGIVVAMVW